MIDNDKKIDVKKNLSEIPDISKYISCIFIINNNGTFNFQSIDTKQPMFTLYSTLKNIWTS